MPRHTNEIIVGRKMCAIEGKYNKVAFILNGKHNEIHQQGKKNKREANLSYSCDLN